MGVRNISDLVEGEAIELERLSRKKLALDAYNVIYQFLASIRGRDGTLLSDARGKITSHLTGLLYRNAKLLEKGIYIAYVFDGEPSKLKMKELKRRAERKKEAKEELEEARERGDMDRVRTVAKRTSVLTDPMVDDAKHLLDLMGIPVIEAPQEGEAQAAYLVKQNKVWAVASQDYDSLLFDSPILVRNLTLSGRRKLPRSNRYITINVELYRNQEVLQSLKLSQKQLIDMAILMGTDFNPDGIKGVGPKTAYKYISEHGSLEQVIEKESIDLDVDYDAIRDVFLNPVVSDDYTLEFMPLDVDGCIEFLCNERGFDKGRVIGALKRAKKGQKDALQQRRLDSFFG